MIKLFLTSESSCVLEKLVKYLPLKAGQTLACITTASALESGETCIQREQRILNKLGFLTKSVDLAKLEAKDLEAEFAGTDGFFVHGGNTFYLLQGIKSSGFQEYLLQALAKGRPYIGSSAGSIVLAPDIAIYKYLDQPEIADKLFSTKGLNLIPFVPLVHYGKQIWKSAYEKTLLASWSLDHSFLSLNDNQFIVVEDDKWTLLS